MQRIFPSKQFESLEVRLNPAFVMVGFSDGILRINNNGDGQFDELHFEVSDEAILATIASDKLVSTGATLDGPTQLNRVIIDALHSLNPIVIDLAQLPIWRHSIEDSWMVDRIYSAASKRISYSDRHTTTW